MLWSYVMICYVMVGYVMMLCYGKLGYDRYVMLWCVMLRGIMLWYIMLESFKSWLRLFYDVCFDTWHHEACSQILNHTVRIS